MLEDLGNTAGGAPAKFKLLRATDGTKFFKPQQVAARWGWHVESVRRAIRQGRIGVVIISRRLLIPTGEIERIEAEGSVARVA